MTTALIPLTVSDLIAAHIRNRRACPTCMVAPFERHRAWCRIGTAPLEIDPSCPDCGAAWPNASPSCPACGSF